MLPGKEPGEKQRKNKSTRVTGCQCLQTENPARGRTWGPALVSSEAERWTIPCQICIINYVSSSTWWFACGSFVQRCKRFSLRFLWCITFSHRVHLPMPQWLMQKFSLAVTETSECWFHDWILHHLTLICYLSFAVSSFHCTWHGPWP